MPDVTVKKIDDMESVYDGSFVRARADLGIKSFGMQIENWPPNSDQYPTHAEDESGQEEVYIALSGSGTLICDGVEHALEPGVFARVGPGQERAIKIGDQGMQLLCLGGVPGQAYDAPEWSELGAPPPGS